MLPGYFTHTVLFWVGEVKILVSLYLFLTANMSYLLLFWLSWETSVWVFKKHTTREQDYGLFPSCSSFTLHVFAFVCTGEIVSTWLSFSVPVWTLYIQFLGFFFFLSYWRHKPCMWSDFVVCQIETPAVVELYFYDTQQPLMRSNMHLSEHCLVLENFQVLRKF